MISLPPPSPARPFSISRVWPCTSCGYLAKSDILSAACPNCGRVGLERSNVGSRLSPGLVQAEAEGMTKDSALSGTMHEDTETFVARSPSSCTLFIPAAESSVDVIAKLTIWLEIDASVIFGEYPADLSGTTTRGYLVENPQSITMEEIADLSSFLNSPPTSNFETYDNLPNSSLRSHDPAGILDSVPAAVNSRVELQDEWETVHPSTDQSIEDIPANSKNMSAPDIKPDDKNAFEPLDNRYSLITKPQRFFKVGRVFMTLWSEPASSTARSGPNLSSSTVGGKVFSEIRRFVVVRSGYCHAICCPIQTYQKRGTTKSRVGLESHAIVYVAGYEPKLLPDEESPGMGNFPIVIEDKSVTIDLSSRLNFSKVYTVEHNIKVRNVGKISKESLPRLKAALAKSMGVNVSDGEAETGTESEDNVPRPTPIGNQPGSYTLSSNSTSTHSVSSHSASSHSGSRISSRSTKRSSSASTRRMLTYWVSSAGIDREVITTDICRYLGNDALIRPGKYQDPKTGQSKEGYYITAYRPPTSAQLADIRTDSLRWKVEREKQSNSARATGSNDESATRESQLRISSLNESSVTQAGYPPSVYGQVPPLPPPPRSSVSYDLPTELAASGLPYPTPPFQNGQNSPLYYTHDDEMLYDE